MGKTCYTKVVGYFMGNKNDLSSKDLSHLHSEILGPFVLDHWFRTEFKRGSEKGPFDIFLACKSSSTGDGQTARASYLVMGFTSQELLSF